MMNKFYGESVYILVDEYDAGIMNIIKKFLAAEIYDGQKIQQYLDVASQMVTAILSSCAKDVDKIVKKIVMTGVTEVLSSSGSSGFNNVEVHVMGSD
jgi:hypothetical protein